MITRRSADPPNPPTHPSSKTLSSSRQRAGSNLSVGGAAASGSGVPLFRDAAADPAQPTEPAPRRRSPASGPGLMQPPPVPSTSGTGGPARDLDAAADSAPRDPRIRQSPVRQNGQPASSASTAAHAHTVGWAEAVQRARAEAGLTTATGSGGAAPSPQAGPGPRSTAATRNVASTSTNEEATRGNVIDLTSSSPPASARRRLVPAARFAGLALPELGGSGPSSSDSRRRSDRTSVLPARAEMVISSDDDDSDDSDYTTAASGRAGPSSYTGPSAFHPAANIGRARRALPARAARATRFESAYATDSDSEIEVVSERPASRSPPPARPPQPRTRYSELGAPIASPPPFIVPDGATSTTGTSSRRRSNPRRSTRIRAGADAPMNLPDDSVEADAALARALAQADANDRGVQDYLAGQTYGTGGGGPARGSTASRGGRGRAAGTAAAGGGGRGYRGLLSDQSLLDLLMSSGYEALGGALWRGGMNVLGGAGSISGGYYGGVGGGGYSGPVGGWGGAAKVKAASKKYGVRMSHPTPVERGFSRDIVEPRDPDAPPAEPSTATKKSRSKKPTEELEPVCASCLETLLLSGSGDKKVFGLRCGHVVCARCLNEAKARCRAIREQEKGGWVVDTNGPAKNGYKAPSGKGKGKAPEMPGTLSLDDDDDNFDPTGTPSSRPPKRCRPNGTDTALPNTTSKGKGKGKSRADETGVEEDWTSCPVATCDGKGSDLLAEEGWARPYELFA